MIHTLDIRVYYEDTDLGGIVYYANYLKYFERARSEALRAAGVDQARLKAERGLVFVVTRVEVDYRRPARFDDMLRIETEAQAGGAALLTLRQTAFRDATTITEAVVKLAAIGPDGRPVRMPAAVAAALR